MKLRILILLGILLSASPAMAGERILALTPHVCEILFAIGAGEDVVGAVEYCDYPEAAKSIPRVGGYRQVYAEPALRAEPTLAIALEENLPGLSVLKQHGVRVLTSYPQSVEGMIAEVRRLGEITGHKLKADELADRLQLRLEVVRQHQKQHPPVGTFYEIWTDPLLTCGGVNFISALLEEVGLHNVFADVALDTPRISIESVVRARPELIVIPGEKRNIDERRTFWQHWLGPDIRIIEVDPDLMHRPGPRLLDGLEALQRAVQEQGYE